VFSNCSKDVMHFCIKFKEPLLPHLRRRPIQIEVLYGYDSSPNKHTRCVERIPLLKIHKEEFLKEKIKLLNLRFQVAWIVDYWACIRTFSTQIHCTFILYQLYRNLILLEYFNPKCSPCLYKRIVREFFKALMGTLWYWKYSRNVENEKEAFRSRQIVCD
jgi:hypothetical protein